MAKRTRGHPRKFENAEELLELFATFCEEIKDNDYKIVPYITEFNRWLNKDGKIADRRTVYLSIHKYYPEIKKEVEQLQSETMSQGAMLGKYKETSTIFALKCKCGWSENNSYDNNNHTDKQNDLVNAIKQAMGE